MTHCAAQTKAALPISRCPRKSIYISYHPFTRVQRADVQLKRRIAFRSTLRFFLMEAVVTCNFRDVSIASQQCHYVCRVLRVGGSTQGLRQVHCDGACEERVLREGLSQDLYWESIRWPWACQHIAEGFWEIQI